MSFIEIVEKFLEPILDEAEPIENEGTALAAIPF
jgi:hypothetical protein